MKSLFTSVHSFIEDSHNHSVNLLKDPYGKLLSDKNDM